MSDCFHDFFERFEKGEFFPAISQILPNPNILYDDLSSKELLFPNLVNYVDAAIFGSTMDAFISNQCLLGFLEKNEALSRLYPRSLAQLKREHKLLHQSISKKELENDLEAFEEIQSILKTQSFENQFFEKKIPLSQGWMALQKIKPYFSDLYKINSLTDLPWYPLRYFLPLESLDFSSSKIPVLFLEPYESDFSELQSQLQNRPALFLFETRNDFMQMLQFPNVVQSFCDPDHLIYILEFYPNSQLVFYDRKKFLNKQFQPFLISQKKQIETVLPHLMLALKECLAQSDEELKNDSESGNWLYQMAKRLLFSIKEKRLGISRISALTERTAQLNWRDPHKEMPVTEKNLGPPIRDNMEIKLNQFAKNSLKRKRKLRLVHIVPQVVDSGHAPSRLLENLISYHDKEKFELFLISTERLELRPLDYPYNFHNSNSSKIRAPNRLDSFRNLGVKVTILEKQFTYEQSAQFLVTYLSQIRADIAVFHGPDVINNLTTQMTDVPLRILFEHGTPPSYPGYDLVIVSSLAGPEIYRELFAKLKSTVKALPFQLDARLQWKPDSFPKEQWGIPENGMIMTTISFNLGSRLGSEMCLAIAEILKRVPHAYYVPMGNVDTKLKEKFKSFFAEHHVDDRVIFLDSVENPSQYARSMHLYLNEFPFGSCLGILDAMASGCPVVTMYNVEGPQQGRYGGHFFGIDRAITSGKREDYVELACKLLTNREMYREWSEHSKKQYEKHADVIAYVKAFESIVLDAYAHISD